MSSPSALSGLDAVTVDAFGTLVELDAPVARLRNALAERGANATEETVAAAFGAEVEYYTAHKVEATESEALRALRRECARVFLESTGAALDPDEFAPAFVEALVFRPAPGAEAALAMLRSTGLALACVSDWDIGLSWQLERVGLRHYFDAVVTSAEVGVEKPDPAVFRAALERLGVQPKRALHVGDGAGDEQGALAAGLAFEPAPLATLPERLGLRSLS
jgi:putative hydrolase of the HAD superfamily